jgi:hypothetical protein
MSDLRNLNRTGRLGGRAVTRAKFGPGYPAEASDDILEQIGRVNVTAALLAVTPGFKFFVAVRRWLFCYGVHGTTPAAQVP